MQGARKDVTPLSSESNDELENRFQKKKNDELGNGSVSLSTMCHARLSGQDQTKRCRGTLAGEPR